MVNAMESLKVVRAIKRALNLGNGEAYPNLELLLERETKDGVTDFRLFSYIVPASIAVFGILSVVGAIVSKSVFTLPGAIGAVVGTVFTGALCAWTYMLFQRLHKSVPVHRARIRQLCAKLTERYTNFLNVVGVSPALSPEVAEVLDAGAGIYLKHANRKAETEDDTERKTRDALEAAMAKLLELGQAQSPAEQQIEFNCGWALPLLDEMAAADRALDRYDRNRRLDKELADNDPLAHLRASRLELQEADQARNELDQRN